MSEKWMVNGVDHGTKREVIAFTSKGSATFFISLANCSEAQLTALRDCAQAELQSRTHPQHGADS